MKIFIFLLLPLITFGQTKEELRTADTLYPIKVFAGETELICFKKYQADRVYRDWQLLLNCNKAIGGKDSLITSLKTETQNLGELDQTNRALIDIQSRKIDLYESIIKEKNTQLTLAKREGLINQLSNKNKIWNVVAISVLTGLVTGYAIAK